MKKDWETWRLGDRKNPLTFSESPSLQVSQSFFIRHSPMRQNKRFFDAWFVTTNTVYKEVPYNVVTDWVQQGRLGSEDMLKPSGTANWFRIGGLEMFQPYLPAPDPIADVVASREPVEFEVPWKRSHADDDEDVDMIPLIDISLVLLIFFMMTTTIAAISRISVPEMSNATKIDKAIGVLRIDLERKNGQIVYSLAIDKDMPSEDAFELNSVDTLFDRLNGVLSTITTDKPKVRLAADKTMPTGEVEEVTRRLNRLRDAGSIREWTVEVNERQKP